ncbi:MAG TPA: zinc-dependent metalloprotease [Flavipsychrobacter sp.]|nr:zinc-dependent metalloprotease [Flavipsychrobacter sp.]
MVKRFFSLLIAASCVVSSSYSQKVCATDEVYQKLKQQHPEISVYESQLEQSIKLGMQKINLSKFARIATASTFDDSTYYDIPIVIHIIHDYGAENLNDTAIINAVNYWTTVYQLQNTDTSDVIAPFKKYIGNPKIRLHLATIDPNGNPTKGITRHQSYLTASGGDQAKFDDWPQDSYVNVWFINTFGAGNTGAAAYAYYPSSGAAMPYYDGVIGLYSYMNYDKAIPHEFGHVFNLEHPWGNTNQPGVGCGDDEVDDTPPTMGHNPVGCVPSALYDVTCAVGYSKTYPTAVPGVDSVVDYPDTVNAQNIMDYTYCQKMFTKGQVERMRLALASNVAGRNNLYSAANLAKTGALAPMPDLPPVADFVVANSDPFVKGRDYYLCENVPFVFRNESWNDTVSGVSWTFSNGASTPTSTIMSSVKTSFTQPGWVSVSLTATSNAGSNTITKDSAVYVADTTIFYPGNYTQDFASTADFANWPMFNYYNNNFKWEWYNKGGYDDGACIRYRSFDDRVSPANVTGTPTGDYDDIFTPAFNLSGHSSGDLNLNFYTAGAYVNPGRAINDSMQILISTDCGQTWQEISVLSGTSLINNGAQSSEFAPSSTQWQPQSINIPVAYRANKAFFKFRYWPGTNGNNLYMDKFSVSQWTTDVQQVASFPNTFRLYPNPAHDNTTLMFITGNDGKVSYEIKDIAGRVVYQKQAQFAPNSIVKENLQANIFPAPGMYFVTVMIANNNMTQKLIIN